MPASASYTDVHRAFLQAVSQHGTVSAKQAYKILLSEYGKYHNDETVPTEDDVPDAVALINSKLHRFDKKIVFVHYEPTNADFYCFCPQAETAVDRLQNYYSKPELSLFRLMLKELACSEGHKVRPIVCLNLTAEITGKTITKVRAEELLDEWEKLGYFVQMDEMWYFGPKTVAEFDRYLSAHFAEHMHKCLLCNEMDFYVRE
ncbi:non-structural maintenance of chromosomes element 1 homolog isoform X2 [Toxorhynchites rutilus septentrionalis]|uniref:non-structural maintenance of chromosomes element 1 homolog isoform X2 n=1 Tax=Toxorhynchites rutilus septentrionalis TaxID=329112 RepID=UPI00247A6DA5|nr:non-structural maintenance of chromosomes element 1 homolog isoform X2 [Toxorhynchites rutilus septentrionalis]